ADSTSELLVDVANLAASLQRFADDRDWQQFHSPKNLLLALTGETGELCEIFQWMSEADAKDAAKRPETAQAVKDELADVLMYLVRLST
ncbi:nucleotide pyrophosphohydrolase, partial [Pseudomonas sp. SIMBA_077]